MARTSTRISFGLFALELRGSSAPSTATPLQPFSKTEDLRTDSATSRPYASYEPDFWLLDGQYKFLPDDYTSVHVGMMSAEMSDASGAFEDNPVLTITFQQPQTVEGLALRFSTYTGDYASEIEISYFDAEDDLIRSDSYTPDGVEFATGQAVEGFTKIEIEFIETNRPFRYLRLKGVDYGELVTFAGDAVKSARVIEEVDPLSAEIRINTLDLTLYSADAQFSIINPSGDYASLTERQPLAVYEVIDGVNVFIGQYYLDEWENASETEYLFRATDILGVIDRLVYRGGIWIGAGIALPGLLEDILGGIDVPYELGSELETAIVRGWLPICSYREALQQIALAVGASVDCSRSGAIRIYPTRLASAVAPAVTITRDQQANTRLALRSQVTAVQVAAHNYVAGTETISLLDDTLAAGTHEITFNRPAHSLSVSGATIEESGVNYAILSVVTPGAVTLDGDAYIDTQARVEVVTPELPAGVRPNVLVIDEATLVNNANVNEVAERVHAYYQQRYRQTMRMFAPTVEIGWPVAIETLYGKTINAVIEKMSIDLAGGMVADMEAVGVSNEPLE